MKKNHSYVGIRKKDFFEEWDKQFFEKGDVTTCVITIGIPAETLMNVIIDKKEAKKFAQRFPKLGLKSTARGAYFVYTAKGKSRCMPGDKYDAKLGHNIADAKAEMKIFSLMSRLLAYIHYRQMCMSKKTLWASRYFDKCHSREYNFVSKI